MPPYYSPKIKEDYHTWYVAPMNMRCYNCDKCGHSVRYCGEEYNASKVEIEIKKREEEKKKDNIVHQINDDNSRENEGEDEESDRDVQKDGEIEEGNVEKQENINIESGIGDIEIHGDEECLGEESSKDNKDEKQMIDDNGDGERGRFGELDVNDDDERTFGMNERTKEYLAQIEEIVANDIEGKNESGLDINEKVDVQSVSGNGDEDLKETYANLGFKRKRESSDENELKGKNIEEQIDQDKQSDIETDVKNLEQSFKFSYDEVPKKGIKTTRLVGDLIDRVKEIEGTAGGGNDIVDSFEEIEDHEKGVMEEILKIERIKEKIYR